MDDNYLRQRILDVLNEKIALGYARGGARKPMTRAEHKASYQKRKGCLIGEPLAWKKLVAKRKDKPKPKAKKTTKPRAKKTNKGGCEVLLGGARRPMTRTEHKASYEKRKGCLIGEPQAWKKLVAKRKLASKAKPKAKAKRGGVEAYGRGGVRAGANPYVLFLKDYANKHNLSYGEAIKEVSQRGLWK